MTTPAQPSPSTRKRWQVVDRDGVVVIHEMFMEANAQDEADELNATGLPEGRPYRVDWYYKP